MAEQPSPQEMRMAVAKANFMCLTLFSSAAFFCGLSATGYCNFISRDIILKDTTSIEEICNAAGADAAACNPYLTPSGAGFWGFEATVGINTVECLSYTQFNPFIGTYVTPSFDTKFNSARAFTFVSNFFGGIAWITLMFAGCCVMHPSTLRGLSTQFFLACLFQGLTLLILRSSVCTVGFFDPYFVGINGTNPDDIGNIASKYVDSIDCGLATGSKLAIAATVLYAWCMCSVPGATPPIEIKYDNVSSGQEEEAA